MILTARSVLIEHGKAFYEEHGVASGQMALLIPSLFLLVVLLSLWLKDDYFLNGVELIEA